MNLITAIACEGQEIKLPAIGNGTMLAEIWEFRSPHLNQRRGEKTNSLPLSLSLQKLKIEYKF